MHAANKRHAIEGSEIRRLYSGEGWSMARLADHFGCGQSTIRRRLAEVGIAARRRGPVPRQAGRALDCSWSPVMAYIVGVVATDGNLSGDGRHISIVSKDRDWLTLIRDCLGRMNRISETRAHGQTYYRLQWSDRLLYDWLLGAGLTPAKSLTLGPLQVPDIVFADFLRGCIDGDGWILSYTDRYHTKTKPKYVYERLAVCLTSASPAFVKWVQDTTGRLWNIEGALIRQPQRGDYAPQWWLKYGKRASLKLLPILYHTPDVPCLARKRAKALAALEKLTPQRKEPSQV
jgi:hypothetical protein